MFTLLAVFSLMLNWYRKVYRYKPNHRCNQVRDGQLNKWIGDVSEALQKRIIYKRLGARTYALYTGRIA